MNNLKNAVSAEKYAADNGMIEANVIHEIKEGDLMGQLYRGEWYVTSPNTNKGTYSENKAADKYIEEHSKNTIGAFLLALILGPIGVFYGSMVGGIILVLMGAAVTEIAFLDTFTSALSEPLYGYRDPTSAVSAVAVLIVLWIVGIIVAVNGAMSHNDRVKSKVALMIELKG